MTGGPPRAYRWRCRVGCRRWRRWGRLGHRCRARRRHVAPADVERLHGRERIDGGAAVRVDLEVEVRRQGVPGLADVADHVTRLHPRSDRDPGGEALHVGVEVVRRVRLPQSQRVAGSQPGRIHVLTGDRAGGDGVDRMSELGTDVDPLVEAASHAWRLPAVVVPALRRDGSGRHRNDRCRRRRGAWPGRVGCRCPVLGRHDNGAAAHEDERERNRSHPAWAGARVRSVRLHPWPPRPPGFLRSGQQAG